MSENNNTCPYYDTTCWYFSNGTCMYNTGVSKEYWACQKRDSDCGEM